MIRRRGLKSARAERSRMNVIKLNASAMYQQHLASQRLQSAKPKRNSIVKKSKVK
jgi:hypothetical protein